MNQPYEPRIKNLDVGFVRDRMEKILRSRAETVHELTDPNNISQIRYSSLKMDCELIALDYYGLGYPLEDVRRSFAEAAAASLKVFELMGTEEPFPVYMLDVDPTKRPTDPAFVLEAQRLNPSGTRDYSITNSHRCFMSICHALIPAEYEIVDKLAKLMWDPPKASYINIRSDSTPNRIHLAYALKHLLQEKPAEAHQELARVTFRKPDEEASYMAKMVRGLVDKSDAFFMEGLQELLNWHKKKAKHPSNFYYDPDLFFCVPAVALCILAIRRGLIQKTQLPDNPYFPLELIPES
jgi:Immunity protein 49